jgi:hypothetical protein
MINRDLDRGCQSVSCGEQASQLLSGEVSELLWSLSGLITIAVIQCNKRSCVLFCCVGVFVLCFQRGSSRVYLRDVSLTYTVSPAPQFTGYM